MGLSASSQFEGYDNQLFRDKTRRIAEIPCEEKGSSLIIRNPSAKDGFLMFLKDEEGNDISTGWAAVNNGFKKYADLPLFGYRPFSKPEEDASARGTYKWDTYRTVQQQVYALANGLRSFNLAEKSNIGIFSSNREEWLVTHLANWNLAYRTVALYDTLGPDAVQYITAHAELEVIFVEKHHLSGLFEAVESAKDGELKLKYVIQYDVQEKFNNSHEAVSDEDKQKATQLGLELIGFTELLNKGGNDEITDMQPTKDDLAFIMYTSGTTGNPKGVMLSHQSFACVVASVTRFIAFQSDDSHVSFLPLAHIMESGVQTCLISAGARIAFFNGNIKLISNDWLEMKPTIMMGVPRIFNKTYDKIKLKIDEAGGIKKKIFYKALAASSSAIRQGKRSGLYDKIMWSKIAAMLGYDNVRYVVSGAAPLPPHIGEFLRIVCKDAIVLQGYGLTETCAASFVTPLADLNVGHIGIPVDNIEARLIDAPECEYFVTDEPHPRGEIQIRGPTLMNGYYKEQEKTSAVLDAESGWFSTGDIGRLNPNGTVSIIDRRKNMFKTAQGEYIAAEKCETVYSECASVGQIWIYGNSFKSFVVGIIVPDALWLVPQLIEKGLWKDEGLTPATPEYCAKFKKIVSENYDTVKEIVGKDIKKLEATSGLQSFEKIRDFYIEHDIDELLQGFNVARDTLTPTFKMRRPQLLRYYVEQIKKMYADNGEPALEHENW